VSTVYGALPETDDEHHDESTTRAIGLALLAGFALMLLSVPLFDSWSVLMTESSL